MPNPIQGEVSGFRESSEETGIAEQRRNLKLWDFRVQVHDENGDLTSVVPVQMKGRSFDGGLRDGDLVELSIPSTWDSSRALILKEITRISPLASGVNRSMVRSLPDQTMKLNWIAFAAFVLVMIVGGTILYVIASNEDSGPPKDFRQGPPSAVVVTVPNVVGSDFSKAFMDLGGMGLMPVQKREQSTSVAKDKVIRTEPAAGARLDRGSTIIFYVSSGR